MNAFDMICMTGALLALLVAVSSVVGARNQSKRLMDSLNKMLDSAIDGSFSEKIYDESTLSALEAKMSRYLSGCSVSSKNLTSEKEEIKTLISDISHQTKTPIANILLYSQLLSEYELTAEGKICVNALSQQAEKLSFLIGALVKTSRLETGIITVSPQNAAVQTLLDSVAAEVKPRADQKNIAVIINETSDHAHFDMKWTIEALYNLVDNAVKYSPNGTAIIIKTRPYELFYRIDVIDEGIGIDEAEQSQIFTRFYRSQAVMAQEGAGIGLFLAREIIGRQQGYIKVASSRGNGATFSVFLPMAK
ncbi:sensor histidine kinase [Acetobacterium bakii]|uniref:histidine kinase n=1 Tax=Acetobacterium bakii TaxID=52689 RepID=A0A0L6U3S1_9FIRM|nr:HAMP domain-containing sensor histidine kinase [Acetobacterium bakii]KNZ43166.1 histidine kinase [Acetobacterium bakii]